MFAPNALELGTGVLCNDSLNILDVTLVEGRRLAIFENHEIGVLFS